MKKNMLDKAFEYDRNNRYLTKSIGAFIGAGIAFCFLIAIMIMVLPKYQAGDFKYLFRIILIFGVFIVFQITLGVICLLVHKRQKKIQAEEKKN